MAVFNIYYQRGSTSGIKQIDAEDKEAAGEAASAMFKGTGAQIQHIEEDLDAPDLDPDTFVDQYNAESRLLEDDDFDAKKEGRGDEL